jgi:2-C-methyl-D-erythritol 4-phosphate cytidylyltransferase
MSQFGVILPAAGQSSRFGDPRTKKIYHDLDGRAVWLRAIEPFVNRDDVAQIVLAIAPEDREVFERRYRANVAFMNIKVIDGGKERADTVARAIAAIDGRCDYVAIHDAARPCLAVELVDAVFAAAKRHGAALLAVPVSDTIKRANPAGESAETVARAGLYLAQTPQVFKRTLLEQAYQEREKIGARVTDDCQLVEALGHTCAIVAGSPLNIKITTAVDLKLAAAILPLLRKPVSDAPLHPYADTTKSWDDIPKLKPSDLFDT